MERIESKEEIKIRTDYGFNRQVKINSHLRLKLEEIKTDHQVFIDYHYRKPAFILFINLGGPHELLSGDQSYQMLRDEWYLIKVEGKIKIKIAPCESNRIMILSIEPDCLELFLGQTQSEYWKYILKSFYESKNNDILHREMLKIEEKEKLERVWNCRLEGEDRPLFYHGIALEWFLTYNSQAIQKDKKVGISGAERIKQEQARRILKENYQNPPSISELSRLIQLNEFKLKKYFKLLYEETIYDRVRKVRMERARILLLKSDMSILRISMEVGYSNPSHFSRAFRKHFNCNPARFNRTVEMVADAAGQ